MNGYQEDQIEMSVTPEVLEFATSQGISLKSLIEMVDLSAKVSHRHGNRRYHSWLFKVENNVVIRMLPLVNEGHSVTIPNQIPTPGPGEFLAFDECEACEGVGCELCNFDGDVPVIRKLHRNGVKRER